MRTRSGGLYCERMNGLGHSRLWSDVELHCAGLEW